MAESTRGSRLVAKYRPRMSALSDEERQRLMARGLRLNEYGLFRSTEETRDPALRLPCHTEVDILKEKLDFPDDLLAELDVVVASLHVAGSDEADNTKRLLRAAENPHVHMMGHLTGRLLLERNPYPVNQQAVIDACAATGTWIELNASQSSCNSESDRIVAGTERRGFLLSINALRFESLTMTSGKSVS